MSSNFKKAMKNIKEGKHVFMFAVLHGIAQIPVGKAQNLAQNEFIFSYSDEHRYLCVDVCCFTWNSSNSSGEGSKSSTK